MTLDNSNINLQYKVDTKLKTSAPIITLHARMTAKFYLLEYISLYEVWKDNLQTTYLKSQTSKSFVISPWFMTFIISFILWRFTKAKEKWHDNREGGLCGNGGKKWAWFENGRCLLHVSWTEHGKVMHGGLPVVGKPTSNEEERLVGDPTGCTGDVERGGLMIKCRSSFSFARLGSFVSFLFKLLFSPVAPSQSVKQEKGPLSLFLLPKLNFSFLDKDKRTKQ